MRSFVLLVLVALVTTASAQGNSVQYRVKQDDTLDVIAAEFYGDRSQAKLIVAENKLTKQKRVQPGQRLKIPVTREITTAKGDTFKSLAQQHLGDERRAVVLADFNEHDENDALPTGTLITIPIQIVHVAQATETFGAIASQYWGDPKQGDMLRRYNFLDKPSLEKGESVIVPIMKVRVRKPAPLDPESRARRDQQHEVQEGIARALPLARTAWLAADFTGVKTALMPFVGRMDYLDTAQAVECALLLGKAQVALDDATHAIDTFKLVLARKPTQQLSAYYDSPKVVDAWKKAGGQVAP